MNRSMEQKRRASRAKCPIDVELDAANRVPIAAAIDLRAFFQQAIGIGAWAADGAVHAQLHGAFLVEVAE